MTNLESMTYCEKEILSRLIKAQPEEGHGIVYAVRPVKRKMRPVFFPEGSESKEENYVRSPYDRQKTAGILKDLVAREVISCSVSPDREVPNHITVCHLGYHTCELFRKRLGNFLLKSILTPILVALVTAFLTALLTLRLKYGL